MARFYTSTVNSRGNPVTAMSHKGQNTHTRGWHSGVRVVSGVENDVDVFYIYATTGSRTAGPDVLLGKLVEGSGFYPNDLPAFLEPISEEEGFTDADLAEMFGS